MISAKQLLLFCLLSLGVGIYGSGLSYKTTLTPKFSQEFFDRIYPDGWIENGASVTIKGLAPIGNRLRLQFNNWHPPGAPQPNLTVSVCNQPTAEFAVLPGAEQVVALRGFCSPLVVSFKVNNPYIPSNTDQRELAAQLESIRIESRLGVALVDPKLIVLVACAVLILTMLVWELCASSNLQVCAYLMPCLAFWLMARSRSNLSQVGALWMFLTLLLAGVLFASKHKKEVLRIKSRPLELNQYGISFAAALVTVGAALLRLYGIDFGLPNSYHPDEYKKYKVIMSMIEHGDLNPRYFFHPSLLLYLTYGVNNLFHLLDLSAEWPDTLILAGRFVSSLAGTLSVYLLFLIGRRLWSAWVGLLAATLLAVSPLHVTCSRYLKEDSLLLFVILAALLVMIKAVQQNRKQLLFGVALLVGVASSVKYTGILSVLILIGSAWLRSGLIRPDWSYLRWCLLSLVLVPIAFFACSPYLALDFQNFIADLQREQSHMSQGHSFTIDAWSQLWMFHFAKSLLPGMTDLAVAVALAGLGILLWRRRVEDLLIVALLLLFYLPAEWVKAKPAPQPERYALLCVPVLALAAGEFLRVVWFVGFRKFVPLLLILIVGVPLVRTFELNSEITYDTRERMADWMRENLVPGSKVLIDWRPYAPSFKNGEFQVTNLPREHVSGYMDLGKLRSSGYDYLLLSSLLYDRYFSQPNAAPVMREKLRQVFKSLPLIKEVKPRYGTYGFHNPTLKLFELKANSSSNLKL